MDRLKVLSNTAEDGGGCGSCEANGGSESKCGNGLEKVYRTTAVRYGYMKHIGEFTYAEGMKFTCGAKVVVQTNRGIEIGELVSVSCTGCDKHVSREQIKSYITTSGDDVYRLDNGRILREATPDDLLDNDKLQQQSQHIKQTVQQRAGEHQLEIKIVEIEYLFGGERIVIYFTAEGRVDFRELVRSLSRELQTRIKMHQVGARDEARLLADFETCGREVCCKVFLKSLKPITMRMAKLQRATLDPTKVSGRCGRLKCCLRYEHDSYEELDARLPRKGERIKTAHGYGTVIDRQILTQLVSISRADGGGVVTSVIEDVEERGIKQFPPEASAPPPSQSDEQDKPKRPRRPRSGGRRRGDGERKATGEKPSTPKQPRKDAKSEGATGSGEGELKKRRRRRGKRRPRSGGNRGSSGDGAPPSGD